MLPPRPAGWGFPSAQPSSSGFKNQTVRVHARACVCACGAGEIQSCSPSACVFLTFPTYSRAFGLVFAGRAAFARWERQAPSPLIRAVPLWPASYRSSPRTGPRSLVAGPARALGSSPLAVCPGLPRTSPAWAIFILSSRQGCWEHRWREGQKGTGNIQHRGSGVAGRGGRAPSACGETLLGRGQLRATLAYSGSLTSSSLRHPCVSPRNLPSHTHMK